MALKILWVVPDFPYPLTSGVVGIYNRIKELSRRGHQIFLFSIITSQESVKEESISELRKYCKDINLYKTSKYEFIYNLLFSPLMPFRTSRRFSRKAQEDINIFFKLNDVDALIIEHAVMDVYLPKNNSGSVKKVLMAHGIVHKAWLAFIKFLPFLSVKKWGCYLEAFKIKRLESNVFTADEFDEYWFNSKEEIQDICREFPRIKDKIEHVPLGLESKTDLEVKSYEIPCITPTTKMILNIGSMGNPANEDAVRWFTKEIFPKVKSEVPDAKFFIVGKNSSRILGDIASEDVIVTGEVQDVRPYLNRCDLYVIPQRAGGGVRTKFVEGLSAKKIILSTAIGMDGVEGVEPDKSFLLATNEEDLINKTIDVLKAPDKYKEIAENGFKVFTTFHTLEIMGDKVEKYLLNLMGNPPSR